MRARRVWELTRQTALHWKMDNAPVLGAALAYYAVLALPEILILLLFLVSFFYGSQAASAQISERLTRVVGKEAGSFLGELITDPKIRAKAPSAIAIAVVVFIVTATGFFVELQRSVNSAWGIKRKSKTKLTGLLSLRLVSFVILIVIGFLLTLSVVISTELGAVRHALGYDQRWMTIVWHALDFGISCGVATVLFAIIFKFLPDAKVSWREVLLGSLVTAILFTIGKSLIALYFSHLSTASTFGVAGAFLLLLIWINYSAQIFLFGAEFTRVYCRERGCRIQPSLQAEWNDSTESNVQDRLEPVAGGHSDGAIESPKQVNNTRGKPGKGQRLARHGQPAPAQGTSMPEASPPRSSDSVRLLAQRVQTWHSFLHRGKAA